MAARINRMHSEQVRLKIQAEKLVERLSKAGMGEIEITAVQLGAINSLLDRSVPKLSQIQHVGDNDSDPISHKWTVEMVRPSASPTDPGKA
jgi:hypothetical protein